MFQLAIDVSKKILDVCLLREGAKGWVKTRKFKNASNAASAVTSLFLKQQCEPIDIHIVMEATGVYHKSLNYRLHDTGAKVSLANQHRCGE